jgi:hypothetical protein
VSHCMARVQSVQFESAVGSASGSAPPQLEPPPARVDVHQARAHRTPGPRTTAQARASF